MMILVPVLVSIERSSWRREWAFLKMLFAVMAFKFSDICGSGSICLVTVFQDTMGTMTLSEPI